MAKRTDYSALVSLDLTPTEAQMTAQMFAALAELGILAPDERALALGLVQHIDRRLRTLAWPPGGPSGAHKMPFPL